MEYRKIPKTDLTVSSIALGTWVFGGEMWSGSDERDCRETVSAALAAGINLIDTAPVYGNGRSEELIGQAIKGRRADVVLATKCGLVSNGKRILLTLAPESIRQEIDQSLRRLEVDVIDIYQCHWPDKKVALADTLGELERIKKSGKIRYIGLSNFSSGQLAEALKHSDIVTMQGPWSLLDHTWADEVHSFCQEEKVGIFAYGPLGGGILTGKYQAPPQFAPADARSFFYKYYQGEAFKKASQLVTQLQKIPHPVNQTAINGVRQQSGVSSVLVGARTPVQLQSNIEAASWQLSPEELNSLREMSF